MKFLKLGGGVARRQVLEDEDCLVEQLSALVECGDGVLEGGFIGVFADVLHLALMFLHAQLDGLAEMLGRDAVVIDDAIFGCGFVEERIAALVLLPLGRAGESDCTDKCHDA